MALKGFNAYKMAQEQFLRVAKLLELDQATQDLLIAPMREYHFLIPVRMDDGHIKIFKGFRGRPKSDIDVLEKSIVSLSEMIMNHPEINELNINPLLVHEEGNGATVADCRVVLKPPYDSGR